METRKIVRTYSAGVFFGEIKYQDRDHVVVEDARRIWYWAGAASLSELAQRGTSKPDECKFPCPVDEIELFGVIEILSVTPKAAASIDRVKEWKAM